VIEGRRLQLARGVYVAAEPDRLVVGMTSQPLLQFKVGRDAASLLLRFSEPVSPEEVVAESEAPDATRAAIRVFEAEGVLTQSKDEELSAPVDVAFHVASTLGATPDIDRTDPAFVVAAESVRGYTMTSLPLQYATYTATRHVAERGIPGAIVECGCWRGGSMMLAARALQDEHDTARQLYLYDTFDWSFDTPGPEDRLIYADSPPTGDHSAIMSERATPDEVAANLGSTGYPPELVHIVRGRVQDTLQIDVPEQVALLRLDTDFYESTLLELERLYPRLATGGVLIVDDYGKLLGPTEATNAYLAQLEAPPLLIRVDIQGRMAIKP
jgi:O-methyltransferase